MQSAKAKPGAVAKDTKHMSIMNPNKAQINALMVTKALAAIKKQAEKGANRAFPQPRTARVVAFAVTETLREIEGLGISESQLEQIKETIVAGLETGPLMQGSTLQKAACKAGIYNESGTDVGDYDV